MNNVIVSGAQQSTSAVHIHVSILPQTPLPSRLPHNSRRTVLNLCFLSAVSLVSSTMSGTKYMLDKDVLILGLTWWCRG